MQKCKMQTTNNKTTMSEYRFHLQKYKQGNKLSCPECGRKKSFVKYVDEEGKIIFPDYVGKCDHVKRCGYHYTPKDYFHDNPDMKHESEEPCFPSKHVRIVEIEKPSFIPSEIMVQTLSHYEINPLYHYLCGVIGKKETCRLFKLYRIGTSKKWEGSTIFWQIDIEGRIRTGKIMNYNPQNGHRIKEPQSYVTWVHAVLKLQDYHLKQCLFGEHLLNCNTATKVMLVESEKTAIIASHFMPDFLWLATGGMNGCFNSEATKVLQGKDVILMPDLGASEEWHKKAELLKPICKSVIVSDVLEQNATEEQRESGLDIADFLLMEETSQMILQRMIRNNPSVQLLIDKFNLEIVEQ